MPPYLSPSVLSLLASSLLYHCCFGTSEAFVSYRHHENHADGASSKNALLVVLSIRTKSRLCGMTPRSSNDQNNDEQEETFDADAVRRKLDQLFPESSSSSSSGRITSIQDLLQVVQNDEVALALMEQTFPPPPLTASDRDRRQAEIQILQQLKEKDDPATRMLWNLWFSERGAKAKKLLEQADNCMNQPDLWQESERILLDLIAEHGPYFTEPINRLATLYYLQGKHEWSYALCLLVLHSKPWHFGALSGIVMVSLGRNDKDKARYWAERRLPTLAAASPFLAQGGITSSSADAAPTTNNPRRLEWVERAVQRAQEALDQAEERTAKSLGKPEEYYYKRGSSSTSSGGDSPPAMQKDESDWQ